MSNIHLIHSGLAGVAPASLVGNKAYNLMRMAAAGLPVPPALVIDTAACRDYFAGDGQLSDALTTELGLALQRLEGLTGRRFGSDRNPLLLSVRSGAPVSMPGMMETVLNIGLSRHTLPGMIRLTGNPALAWDAYRRLIQAYAEVVHRASPVPFDRLSEQALQNAGCQRHAELPTASLRELAEAFEQAFEETVGSAFPDQPHVQLTHAVEAVFRSWRSAKASTYRAMHGIDEALGTAVAVQAMVFGNAGSTSGAGVGFTRDPSTGEDALYLDFLSNAQGEDVVSGRFSVDDSECLERRLPQVHAQLVSIRDQLEHTFGDMQDFEFTVENGALYMLQTRSGKRTALAALRIAVDMVQQGLITPAQALQQLAEVDLDTIVIQRLDSGGQPPLATATAACAGIASGSIAFTADTARAWAAQGRDVVLVRHAIATEDVGGIAAACGVLTATGARTSHAAVVARQLNTVCLVGCQALTIKPGAARCRIGGQEFEEGDVITLDGDHGHVYAGACQRISERPETLITEVRRWAREPHDSLREDDVCRAGAKLS